MSEWLLERLRAELRERLPRRDAPEGVPQAAVALLLAPLEGDLELLLIRRSEHPLDPWSGHMALPGGRRDEADTDLLATVRRVVSEEIGVELGALSALAELDDLRPVSAPARVVVRPFVFELPARPVLALSGEVAAARWSSLLALASSSGETDVRHLGALRRMPCYRLGEDVVWGMTHRILEPFVELARRLHSSR
jgi:8-oxo-dGTP pyrophosphatase MutT (NUDIX family)